LVKDVVFANVKVANITDILSINISSVNDINSETVVENGMLAITSDNLKIKRAAEVVCLLGFYGRFMNNFFLDIGLGFYGCNVYGLYNVKGSTKPAWYRIDPLDTTDDGGFSAQIGLLYSFKWLYLSAGYRQYFNKSSYNPSFYLGGGLCLPNLSEAFGGALKRP